MFALVWRFFPGPAWLRILAILATLVALVWVLITFVYPWVATVLPHPESVVTQ